MPIYEYRCRECDSSFEELVLSTCDVVACPQCESNEVDKQLSIFSSPGDRVGKARVGGGCGCTPSTCGCH
jgi:putative FmdB family regulatory protein